MEFVRSIRGYNFLKANGIFDQDSFIDYVNKE